MTTKKETIATTVWIDRSEEESFSDFPKWKEKYNSYNILIVELMDLRINFMDRFTNTDNGIWYLITKDNLYENYYISGEIIDYNVLSVENYKCCVELVVKRDRINSAYFKTKNDIVTFLGLTKIPTQHEHDTIFYHKSNKF